MSKDVIDNLCIFLKLLYEQTKDKAVPIKIYEMANKYKLPYYTAISTVLISKGIIAKIGSNRLGFTYMWITTTEPNKHMAEAVLNECRMKCNPKKVTVDNTHIVYEEQKKLPTTIDMLQMYVDELKMSLISMGFSKEKALEIIKGHLH